MYYAQIDSNGIVVAVSQLTEAADAPNLIRVDWFDSGLLGKRYNSGVFEDVQQPEPQPQGPTLEERVKAAEDALLQLMLNQPI